MASVWRLSETVLAGVPAGDWVLPGLVHYLPIVTTLMAAAFLGSLGARAAPRGWPAHLTWWAVGVFFYGLGTGLESTITLMGNSAELTRHWYWAGAILGGYPLATGTVYLLLDRKIAHILTACSLVVVIAALVAILLSPLNAEAVEPHRPTGDVIGWQWVRLMTPIINLYAAAFLVGGALTSSKRFLRAGDRGHRRWAVVLEVFSWLIPILKLPDFMVGKNPLPPNGRRALGTALIAVGGLLPGIGGSMAKGGVVEALYIGELVGLALIWVGYELCVRTPMGRGGS